VHFFIKCAGKVMLFGSETEAFRLLPASFIGRDRRFSCLSLSGSNQARKGRLANALAVRGDERRDTLR
jgi:hypothetical protein